MKAYIIIIILSLLAAGCDFRPDDRLVGLSELSDSAPQAVLDSLARIDRATLGEADRHYYDFLTVKATDKAYLTHNSDSLILSVVDYASNHQNHGYYPEALYYCGRVYSDQGDYPTALTYFHQALDQLPEDKNDNIRGNVLSQYGRLLFQLRLYEQGQTYLETVIELERENKDTVNLVYDLQLLGHLFLNSNNLPEAEKALRDAVMLSKNLPLDFKAKNKMYMADLAYKYGNTDSAISLLRGTKELIDSVSYNSVLASGIRFYHKAGIIDTAYQWAYEMINRDDPTNKIIAYEILCSRELREYINNDSIINRYLNDYVKLHEEIFDKNQNELALLQTAKYNYELHDIARQKAEKSKTVVQYWLAGVLAALLITVIIVLYLKNKNQRNLLQLHIAIETIEELKSRMSDNSESIANVREKLRARINELYANAEEEYDVPVEILQSPTYQKLQDYINQKAGIPDSSDIWSDLEKVVLECSPEFKNYLQILSNGSITPSEYKTALLIRCNFSPTNMSVLCNLSRTTINSRRSSLSKKLFGATINLKLSDAIIRYL